MKSTHKSLSFYALAVSAVLGLAPITATPATDLTEIYHRALRNDPQLREAEDNHIAALEAHPQALASLLPQISGSAGYMHDRLNSQQPGFEVGLPPSIPTFSTLTTSDNTRWGLSLRQTVFRWDQIVKLGQSNSVVAQAEVDYRAAQQSVILRAAQAYFKVLSTRDRVEYADASREAITRQLEQANKRFEVGLIAITDVEEAKAAADQATATVIAAKRALADARDQLRELTGSTADELARPGDDMPLVGPNPENEESWVKAALDQNLDLASARLSADIAKDNIAIERSGHYPSVDIVASKSFTNNNGSALAFFDPQQTFSANSVNHDMQVGIQLTLPLYEGGITSSKVREAVYRHRAARERLERTARATERSTRDSYRGVLSEISQVTALKQALASSAIALQATEAGYDVGTRTAVDVLLARQRLLDAQSNYATARYDYVINVLTLEQAAGTLDERQVTRVNAWLNQTVSVK
jgi:outer membrane protein